MDVRRKTTASSSISSTPKYYGGAGAVKQTAVVPSNRLGSKDGKSPTTTGKIAPSTLYGTDKLKKTRSISDKNIDNNHPTATKAAATDQKGRGGSGTDEPVWLQSLLTKDPSLSANSRSAIQQANEIWQQIQAVSIPRRRLSVSDNDLIHTLVQVTNNDPSVTQVVMMADHDPRVLYIEPALLLEVAETLCGNTHVQKLVMTGMKLGNEFAAALATSLQVNCIVEHVDISNNGFTNVKDFLKTALRPHRLSPLTHINIATQHAPVFKHEKLVALIKKHPNIRVVKADFDSSDAQAEIDSILQKRSQSSPSKVDYGSLVVGALEAELVRRKEIAARAATGPIEIPKMELLEHEIPYFLDLEERSKRFQVRQDDDKATGATQSPFLASKASNTSLAQISASLFTGDGAFLTNEFIAKHLVEGPDRSLTFDFNNQSKLFRRFTKSDPARAKIVQRFVDTLVDHPKAASITHVNMANTLLDDDWLYYFCERCCKDPSLLLNLHCLNIESNTITDKGVQSLATGLATPAWKYLQSIKLDNQKAPLSTETETELLHALAKNRTVIKLSLRVRNSCQRDQINLIMTRNIDLLRQARHFTKPSHAKRSRNKVEALFDCIALDDKTITSVSLIADKVFQSLHPQEKVKAASSFASNTHVTTIQMNGLQLDDAFAIELGKSLAVNKTIESVDLESNALGSDGILALVESLETNRSIQTMKIRHQKKPLSSTDEGKVAEFIKDNQVVVSLGLDPLRNPLAKMTVERKISSNQDLKRRSKARK